MEAEETVNGKISMEKGSEGYTRCSELEANLPQDCTRCLELEANFKKLKEKYAALELDLEKKKTALELLEDKLSSFEPHKLALEDELRTLRERNKQLKCIVGNGEKVIREDAKRGAVDLTKEKKDVEDIVTDLLIENKVLDCEKKKAERDVKVWEGKCKELELQLIELQVKISTGIGKLGSVSPEIDFTKMNDLGRTKDGVDSGDSSMPLETSIEAKANEHQHLPAQMVLDSTPCGASIHAVEGVRVTPSETILNHGSLVKRRLVFDEERKCNKKMAPSTPGGTRPPVSPIDITDSDDDAKPNQLEGKDKVGGSYDGGRRVAVDKNEVPAKDSSSRIPEYHSDEEVIHSSIPRKRRASNIVTSEGESEDDDNLPICRLMSKNLQELNVDSLFHSSSVEDTDSTDKLWEPMTQRHLVRLRKIEEKCCSGNGKLNSIGPKNVTFEIDDMDEDDSDTEGESLNGFIVDDSDISDGKPSTNCDNISECDGTCSDEDSSEESETAYQGGVGYDEIISTLRRERKLKKWDFEADMLADFGKDPELCMKAVCALYRQQTSEEKYIKSTFVTNGRGFSQCDALRGSELAEFLTDGDVQGEVKKSVEELQEYNPKGVEVCRQLATRYSKQLFAIYKNQEDPVFGPE